MEILARKERIGTAERRHCDHYLLSWASVAFDFHSFLLHYLLQQLIEFVSSFAIALYVMDDE